MDRRDFLKTVGVAAGVAFLPSLCFGGDKVLWRISAGPPKPDLDPELWDPNTIHWDGSANLSLLEKHYPDWKALEGTLVEVKQKNVHQSTSILPQCIVHLVECQTHDFEFLIASNFLYKA